MDTTIEKQTIILADDNESYLQSLTKEFNDSNEFEVVASVTDGAEALSIISSKKPDVAIFDIVLGNLDGFELLERMEKMKLPTKKFVLSSLKNEGFIQKAISLGADYYMAKPVNFDVLSKRVKELKTTSAVVSNIKNSKNRYLDEKISNIFITVGIPAHIKGYQFLREAIKMAIDNPEIINSITKQLYPSIAERFETSASKVERAIRHAIEVAWNRGKIENINSLFGVKVYSSNDKPTNGEFIALVADKMLIEGA